MTRAVLTKDKVVKIFQQSKSFSPIAVRPSASIVAREYGVSEKTIRDIWKGRTWYNETLPFDMNREPKLRAKTGRPLGCKDRAPRRRKKSSSLSLDKREVSHLHSNGKMTLFVPSTALKPERSVFMQHVLDSEAGDKTCVSCEKVTRNPEYVEGFEVGTGEDATEAEFERYLPEAKKGRSEPDMWHHQKPADQCTPPDMMPYHPFTNPNFKSLHLPPMLLPPAYLSDGGAHGTDAGVQRTILNLYMAATQAPHSGVCTSTGATFPNLVENRHCLNGLQADLGGFPPITGSDGGLHGHLGADVAGIGLLSRLLALQRLGHAAGSAP